MKLRLGPFINNSIGPVLPRIFIYFLGGLALIILLTSCFNFTNLSIARSLTRAREIGVRKTVGASRWHIFLQFLLESIVTALVALVLALVFMLLIKRFLLQLNFARIFRWDLESNLTVYCIFLLFALVVGLVAGIYPAIILSGFKPVKVLRNLTGMKIFFRVGIRKVLLVLQFTVSLFFILSVIVVYNQLKLFTVQDYGFNVEKNIMVKLSGTSPEALKTELLRYNNIKTVTATSHVPATGRDLIIGFKKNIHEPEWTILNHFAVDENYMDNMGLKLLAGRFFSAGVADINKQQVVINEEAVKKLQYSSPGDAIGQELITQEDSTRKTIIGVVKNYNHRTLAQTISPLALTYNAREFAVMQVGYSGNYKEAAESIEKAWVTVHPNLKADYQEVKLEIGRFYDVIFGDIMKILVFVSILAISLSCLGLLGIATYTTETRMREISIRKVLGSSRGSLVYQLSKGFFGVLVTATAIGIPLTYFVNSFWLEMLAYRTSLNALVIFEGIFLLFIFGVLTIGYQTVRATRINPLIHLKNE
jgi:putative ABC transport system permease protein